MWGRIAGMPRVQSVPQYLDFGEFRKASFQLQTLTANLPADAVHALAIEVVERLSASLQSLDNAVERITPEQLEVLCDALTSTNPDAAAIMISELRGHGTSIADIYLHYLAAAARRLGEKWTSDELSFLEVTVGTSRILAIMRGMRSALNERRVAAERLMIFAAVPNEQHTIGITMAADLFRREGWEIELLVGATHDEILESVSSSEALVVGLTAHGEQSLAELIRLIVGIRIVNPAVCVLVSGHIVESADDIITLSGADGVANDIASALVEAKRLLELASV